MPFDDEPDDDVERRAPLPPDDRIWRHPSEVGRHATAGAAGGAGSAPTAPPRAAPGGGRRPRTWVVAPLSALAGAAAMVVVLAAIGAFDQPAPPAAVEQIQIPAPDPDASEQAVGDQLFPAVARVTAQRGAVTTSATAVVFRSDGHLLTTADAVVGSQSLTVILADGQVLPAEVVGLDDGDDLAVVRVPAQDLPTAVLAAEDPARLGARLVVLSTGEAWPATRSVGVGVLSGLGQRLDTPGKDLHGMMQANVGLEGEAAGSVLATTDGAVVGIVTARGLEGGDDDQPGQVDTLELHHATPISWAKHVADQLAAQGWASHVWIGIEGADLSDAEADQAGGRGGAKVRRVVEGSPAARADLRPGDVVTAIDGHHVSSMSDLIVAVRALPPGQVVVLALQRDGDPQVAMVTLAERFGGGG